MDQGRNAPPVRDHDMELVNRMDQEAFDAIVDAVKPTAAQQRVLAIGNPDGPSGTFHRITVNATGNGPRITDAELFGDQLPARQVRDQSSPSAATRAKARAKRKGRKR